MASEKKKDEETNNYNFVKKQIEFLIKQKTRIAKLKDRKKDVQGIDRKKDLLDICSNGYNCSEKCKEDIIKGIKLNESFGK